jgi:cytochrome P450
MSRVVTAHRENPSSHSDLLELLLVARDAETARGMTDAELVTNLAAFISAGHETTAVALTWTLWLVAKNATLQEQLFDEVIAAAGEEPIGAAHLDRLVLCRQAIQEAMRLYPPVASLSRQANVETTLGEHHVKPSTYVIVPVYALHRHVRLWENPNTFVLDRFAPHQAKARPRYAYLPFGGGPRVCIGASFAIIEATVILATLVRAFHFRPVLGHKPRPIARASLRPQGGMPIFIESR